MNRPLPHSLPRSRACRFATTLIAFALVGSLHARAHAQAQAPTPAAPSPTTPPPPPSPSSAPDASASQEATPPEVLTQVDAIYPHEALATRSQADVVLLVTIDAQGIVGEVSVVQSGGEPFDAAATQAVKHWTFKPAARGGMPMPSRIQIPFSFALPEEPAAAAVTPAAPPTPGAQVPSLPITPVAAASAAPVTGVSSAHSPPPSAASAAATSSNAPATLPSDQAVDVTVRGQRPPPARTSSDFVLNHDVLVAAPHADAGQVLSSAPGVYIARPEGDAVAHEIFLRGFDADHGQDVALSAGGIPINQPSHLHGQGYADLNFIPPEVIRSVRVTEGVYDPRQGDFAVAGSIDFDLGVVDRGVMSRTSYGSFNTWRQLVLFAPEGEDEQTFGVASIRRSAGFGENRGSMSGQAMAQYVLGSGADRTVLHAAAYGARGNLAGVLRSDDVAAHRVGFYDSYDDPDAQAQSAFGSRLQLGVTHDHDSDSGARTHFGAWLLTTDFRLREDFTGYLERSEQMPMWVGRGDLIEQSNSDLALGANAYYRTRRFEPTKWAHGTLETGLTFRNDVIDQGQNLLQQPRNETWDRRIDATVHGADIGMYADADWHFTRYVALRGGMRADVLYYDVDDRLGNMTPAFRAPDHLTGFRRTAFGIALGPRGTLEVKPIEGLSLLASYGRGYRSPQALQLEEGENAPYAKVDAAEVGARLSSREPELWSATGAAFYTHLSTDLSFDPAEGGLERIGPTTRQGLAAQLTTRPVRWLLGSFSATWVRATLDSPPPATPEQPNPPFKHGQLLPYVPEVVLRADVSARRDLGDVDNHPLAGRLGFGMSYLGTRPLPYGESSKPVGLLDASAALIYRAFTLSLEVMNLLDSQYAATEFSFVSDWAQTPTPSLLPARHFVAGAPRSLMLSLEARL